MLESIFCKSSYQIYKTIEICNFVLWYHKATIAQMFIFTLLTRIKSPLKESETSRLSKCIFLSWKTGETLNTQNMKFLRRPLENVQEIHLT